jgi:hypothetical protein
MDIDEKRLYQMNLQVVQCLSLLQLYSFSMSSLFLLICGKPFNRETDYRAFPPQSMLKLMVSSTLPEKSSR